MREKVGKSRDTVFFQWFGAPEGRKVGSLKPRVRSQLARWEMKNCTPLWREAHLQVKMHKAPQLRTAFGSCDVEKVHAVVARSTFPSQNVQDTPGSDHFWKFRCRKSAHRCGAKHISKSKCTKHHMFAPLLEVRMLKKVHAVVVRRTFRSKHVKNTRGSDHFWRFRCRFASLHYTTLHYTTLHYTYAPLHYHYITQHYNYNYNYTTTLHYTPTTLNYTTLHYITLHYTPLHYTTLHYTPRQLQLQLQLHNDTPLQYTPLHSNTLNYTTLTLHYTTLHSTTLHYITLHYLPLLHHITLHSTTLQLQLQLRLHNYTPLHEITLHYTTLHYTTLHYIPLHSTTLHYITLHYITLNDTAPQIDR